MQRTKAFTLIEMLAVIAIIALLTGIVLPALAATQLAKHKAKNNTQLRGIHQSMYIFAASKKTGTTSPGTFPGLDEDEQLTSKIPIKTALGGNGAAPVNRYAIMLDRNLFAGKYAIAPVDQKTEWESGDTLSSLNYSYAMLGLVDTPEAEHNPKQGEIRRIEWRETLNSEAVVMADRNTSVKNGGNDAEDQRNWSSDQATSSIWSKPASGENEHFWKGSMVWNDNHAEFKKTDRVDTRYGDDGFKDDYIFDTETGAALMVYSDSTSPGMQH